MATVEEVARIIAREKVGPNGTPEHFDEAFTKAREALGLLSPGEFEEIADKRLGGS